MYNLEVYNRQNLNVLLLQTVNPRKWSEIPDNFFKERLFTENEEPNRFYNISLRYIYPLLKLEPTVYEHIKYLDIVACGIRDKKFEYYIDKQYTNSLFVLVEESPKLKSICLKIDDYLHDSYTYDNKHTMLIFDMAKNPIILNAYQQVVKGNYSKMFKPEHYKYLDEVYKVATPMQKGIHKFNLAMEPWYVITNSKSFKIFFKKKLESFYNMNDNILKEEDIKELYFPMIDRKEIFNYDFNVIDEEQEESF